LTSVIEQAGVAILSVPASFEKIDAYSTWAGPVKKRPIIVQASGAPGDRQRLTLAHELGHLVLHGQLAASIAEVENEANAFAAEFLMPEVTIGNELTPPITLTSIAGLKPRWGVSIQALIRRAKDIGSLNERQYRYLFEQLSKHGWRRREPETLDIQAEQPTLLRQMIEASYGSPPDYRGLAEELAWTEPLLLEVLGDTDGRAPKRQQPDPDTQALIQMRLGLDSPL
jgi:Zn-dependent peptidase ImmA (M78 family)